MVNQTYEVGGAEYFTFRGVLETIMNITHTRRIILSLPPPYMRALFVMLDPLIPNVNISTYWLDYIAINRTCPVDNLPRTFGLMPARFAYRLDYLARKPWYSQFAERIQETFRLPR
jgi:NADH dehydrogenase